MPQKILRLGFTESTLLFYYWLNKYKHIITNDITITKKLMIQWLYTTSGYYDTTIQSSYMDAVHPDCDTEIYNQYMELLLQLIKNSDCIRYNMHSFVNSVFKELSEFNKFINVKVEPYNISQYDFFKFIENKKILIISPFSPLIKSQLENGNCKHIYSNTPQIDTIYTYKFPYTFFNKGPHNNILETADYIVNDIITTIIDDYESVIISCGAYGCIVAENFYKNNKNVLILGGELQYMVGILNGRTKQHYMKNAIQYTESNKQYWIDSIPDEYKPKDYDKIENGCYW